MDIIAYFNENVNNYLKIYKAINTRKAYCLSGIIYEKLFIFLKPILHSGISRLSNFFASLST